MTENYLHFIWRHKRLPFNDLVLTDGRPLLIHNCGNYNEQLAGPDFEMGELSINGIRFVGPIEIHVRSSDWAKHGHQMDPAYRNIILHVVHEDDAPIVINGYRIPTLELKPFLDVEHYGNYISQRWRREEFPCRKSIRELAHPYLETKKSSALHEHLMVKYEILKSKNFEDANQALYFTLASAFGTAVNRYGFERLVQRVPLNSLEGLSTRSKFRLIMVESAIWMNQTETPEGVRIWNRKGTRPSNFPEIRVQQFAQLASKFDFNTAFLYLPAPEILVYFREVINKLWQGENVTAPKPSQGFQNHLLINAIVPFIWFCAQENEDALLSDIAMDILTLLPAEKNAVTRKWREIGVLSVNAYDSQAVLSLYRTYCSRKKCLSCVVGNKALNRI